MVKIKGRIQTKEDAVNKGYFDNYNPFVLYAFIRDLHSNVDAQGEGWWPIDTVDLEDAGFYEDVLGKLSDGHYTKIVNDSPKEVWNYSCQGSYSDGNLRLKMWFGYNCQDIDFAFVDIRQNESGFDIRTIESA